MSVFFLSPSPSLDSTPELLCNSDITSPIPVSETDNLVVVSLYDKLPPVMIPK